MYNDDQERDRSNNNLLTNQASSAYVEKQQQLENMKSTAYTFLPFSLLGLLVIILMWLNMLPIPIEYYMKFIYSIVLGGLLIFFFITGLKAFFQIKLLKDQVLTETETKNKILAFFQENYTPQDFANEAEYDSLSAEQLYFIRVERMQDILNTQYSNLDEAYQEYICEKIYQSFFPDEI